MLEENITIINKLGLHARAAAKFVSHASQFESNIEIIKATQTVNGKSIMGVMMLAASCGTDIQLRIDGADETEALADLKALIGDKFGEAE